METWSGLDAHRQLRFGLRCEWGLQGARAIATGAEIVVVIDVLSFSTAVSVGVERGMTVFPYAWKDERAATFAAANNAILAVHRFDWQEGQVSLSPSSLRTALGIERIVLPSPNGSTLSSVMADGGGMVIAGCLRNARAVAEWISATLDPDTGIVAFVPAGERWADGSLRPAVEDLWGAGAIIDHLTRRAWASLSPEAEGALAAWSDVSHRIREQLADCASGRELVDCGFQDDVDVAAEVNSSRAVPVLRDGAYVDVRR